MIRAGVVPRRNGPHFDEKYRNISGISCARSYRTQGDGSFEGRFTKHFVPGYNQPVPPGRKAIQRVPPRLNRSPFNTPDRGAKIRLDAVG